jgi:hypothetical protein
MSKEGKASDVLVFFFSFSCYFGQVYFLYHFLALRD